jgi:hypothetical protein
VTRHNSRSVNAVKGGVMHLMTLSLSGLVIMYRGTGRLAPASSDTLHTTSV